MRPPCAGGLAAAAREGPGRGRGQLEDVAAEVDEHRGQRAEVAGDVERDLGRPRVPAEQLAHEDEVGGARDGQKLGQPLHDAEPHGLGGGHAASGSGGPAARSVKSALHSSDGASGPAAAGAQARARTRSDQARAFDLRLRRFGFEAAEAAAGADCSRRAARRSLITMAAAAAMKIVE